MELRSEMLENALRTFANDSGESFEAKPVEDGGHLEYWMAVTGNAGAVIGKLVVTAYSPVDAKVRFQPAESILKKFYRCGWDCEGVFRDARSNAIDEYFSICFSQERVPLMDRFQLLCAVEASQSVSADPYCFQSGAEALDVMGVLYSAAKKCVAVITSPEFEQAAGVLEEVVMRLLK